MPSSGRPLIQLPRVKSSNPRAGQPVGVDVEANHRRCGVAGHVELIDLERVHGEVIVMRLVANRRTRPAISLRSEISVPLLASAPWIASVAGARLQSRGVGWNVVHHPMPPAASRWRIGIVSRNRE